MFGWWSIALAADVTLSLERYRALVGEEAAAERAPDPFVARRDVVVRRVGESLRLTATWRVEVPGRAAVALRLAGPELGIVRFTVDGRPGALAADESGASYVAVLDPAAARAVTLVLEGTLPDDPELELELLGAGAGEVALPADRALRGGVELAPGRWVAPEPDRVGILERPASERDRGDLVTGQVGYGVTVADGEVRRVAHLRWSIRSGTLGSVAFSIPGAGPDLRVEGSQVAAVERAGDRVVVTLGQPESTRVDLVVRSSAALPAGDVTAVDVAAPTLEGVFRSEAALVLARDGELDLLPAVTGAAPSALAGLPDWAQGLVDGVTTAAFRGPTAQGRVDAVRFTPASGPATLCDVASITVALSPEGRALVRAHYTIRNDRGHLLRVLPPPGFEPISAQVGGAPVTVSRDGDAWLLPMEKSLETVEGLLTFPVEVAFLAESEAFRHRDRRTLPLPALDVETAVTRVTVHLPPGWEDRGDLDTEGRVAEFTEGAGVSYGFAVGDVRASTSEVYFQDALDAWYDNDFERAQQALDAIRGLGGDNENMLRLQSNLDVVSGKRAAAESAADRRIKDQARARAFDDYERQRALLQEAEEATNAGDYGLADEAYRAAGELTAKLDQLANAEDAAQEVVLEETQKKLVTNAATSSSKAVFRASGVTTREEALPEPEESIVLEEPAVAWGPDDALDQDEGELAGAASVANGWVDGESFSPEGGVVGGVVGGRLGGSFGAGAGSGRGPAASDPSPADRGNRLGQPREDAPRRSPAKPALAPPPDALPAAEAPPPPPPPPPATGSPVTVSGEFLKRIPTGRSYQSALQGVEVREEEKAKEKAVDTESTSRGQLLTSDVPASLPVWPGSGGDPNLSGAVIDGRDAQPAPMDPAAGEEIALRRRALRLPTIRLPHRVRDDGTRHVELPPAKVGVTATSASVVVPTTGDAVRYQHLLLPAGERPAVRLDTKRPARNDRRSSR